LLSYYSPARGEGEGVKIIPDERDAAKAALGEMLTTALVLSAKQSTKGTRREEFGKTRIGDAAATIRRT